MTRQEHQRLFDMTIDRLERGNIRLTDVQTELLVSDIVEVASEPELRDEPFDDVLDELWRRVGGNRNIESYVETLMAGKFGRTR